VSLSELEEWIDPGPPKAENAAWTNAFAAVVRVRGKIPILRQSPCAPLSADQLQYFQSSVASNGVALKRLHEAGNVSRSRYPRNRASGDKAAEFDIGISETALLLEAEAMVNAEARQLDAAIRSLETLGAMARSFESEPDQLLMRTAALDLICESIERILCQNHLNLSERQLTRLRNISHVDQTTEPVTRALVATRCRVIYDFQHWRDQILRALVLDEMVKSDSGERLSAKRIAEITGTFAAQKDEDFAFYLDAMEELIAASKLPYWLGRQASDNVNRRLKEQAGPAPRKRLIYSAECLPDELSKEFAQTMAHLRIVETASAVELYRLAHNGKLPDDLDELVPAQMHAVPTDPLTGQGLRFIKVANGYSISSSAENGTGKPGNDSPHGATLTINR